MQKLPKLLHKEHNLPVNVNGWPTVISSKLTLPNIKSTCNFPKLETNIHITRRYSENAYLPWRVSRGGGCVCKGASHLVHHETYTYMNKTLDWTRSHFVLWSMTTLLYKQWNCQVYCFLLIQLVCGIKDLHNIWRIYQAFFTYFACYMGKLINKFFLKCLSNFQPNSTKISIIYITLPQTYMNIGPILFEISLQL